MTGDEPLNEPITDALTGAYSRGLLAPRLTEELARAARSSTGCALFLFDVDYFKSVNDAYGHQRGDEVLRELAARVHGLVRAYDVLFRYGGDELILLLPDTARADAVAVALRVVDGIKGTEFPGTPPLTVSVSLGVAVFPDDATDPDGLIAVADRRNYLAKHRGRACAVADDAEETADQARPVSSRLLERDLPMTAARDFLTRLIADQSGAMAVTGDRGAGYSRFLEEVARSGRLRGFEVVEAGDAARVHLPRTDRAVLVVVDGPIEAEVMAGWVAGAGGPLGVVHHAGAAALPLPLVETVELLAWSSAALRVWLRNSLRGEPSRILLDWLLNRSGGLPARVAAEVDRLSESGGLVRESDGGWTVAPALLGRARPARKPLPVPLTELVGRQQETAQVVRLISEGRLVTLVGPGGIGKTRLSLAAAATVADAYADGVVFVSLAAAHSADDVVAALAHALDVTELSGQVAAEALTAHLAEQSTLLVLDNVEASPDAADVIADLLAAAPGVAVLVSTRERLGVYGEQVYPVPPLALPDPAALPPGQAGVAVALAASPALALFVARARAATYQFAATTENLRTLIDLCRRLDGLPLAIELAAAHADTLSPAEMLAELTNRLDLPGPGLRGVPERQRTLRGAIEWSVDRLTPEERELFVSLGAFRGGATLEAIGAVCPHEPELGKRLATLVDKSLVRAEPDTADGTRYALLETMVAYTAEHLPSGPRDHHAVHFAALAAAAGTELTGPDQGAWQARVEREYANLGHAFGYALDRTDTATAAGIALGIWRFWRSGAYLGDGRRWLERLLDAGPDNIVRARVLHAAAVLAAAQDDHETARRLAVESHDLALAAGDRRTVAQAANALGIAALAAGDYPTARGFFTEALTLWRDLGEPLGTAMAHGNLTKVALRLGDTGTAARHAEECLALDRAQGNTRGIMLGLLCQGEIEQLRGDRPAARTALAEALALARSLGDLFGEAMARHQLGVVEAQDGHAREALAHMTAATALRRDIGDREDLAISLDALAWLLRADQPVLAARLLGAAAALRNQHRLAEPATAGGVTRTKLLADLGTTLGADGLTAALDTGRWVGLDAVIDDAIEVSV